MADPGAVLRANNDRIIQCILTLKAQRAELLQLIEKQEVEKRKLQLEIERITYKLSLISKSLAQRLAARDKYDVTIKEAEENYRRIVECSGILLNSVTKEYGVLSESIDKGVGTDDDNNKLENAISPHTEFQYPEKPYHYKTNTGPVQLIKEEHVYPKPEDFICVSMETTEAAPVQKVTLSNLRQKTIEPSKNASNDMASDLVSLISSSESLRFSSTGSIAGSLDPTSYMLKRIHSSRLAKSDSDVPMKQFRFSVPVIEPKISQPQHATFEDTTIKSPSIQIIPPSEGSSEEPYLLNSKGDPTIVSDIGVQVSDSLVFGSEDRFKNSLTKQFSSFVTAQKDRSLKRRQQDIERKAIKAEQKQMRDETRQMKMEEEEAKRRQLLNHIDKMMKNTANVEPSDLIDVAPDVNFFENEDTVQTDDLLTRDEDLAQRYKSKIIMSTDHLYNPNN